MKTNYIKKSTISIKMFISELGENFSANMKKRLLELQPRCILTRKKVNYRLDLKHVEHLQYECTGDMEDTSEACKKEYSYGQLQVIDGILYFSEGCCENDQVMPSPIVSTIFNSLDSEGMTVDEDRRLKKVDDSNIDYVVDSILSVCPQVSQAHMDIVKGMVSRANSKYLR